MARIIVVCVDETRGSTEALQFTIESIYAQGDILWLLHCIPGPAGEVHLDELISGTDRFAEQKKNISKRISHVYGSLLEAKKIPYSISIITVPAHGPLSTASDAVANCLCRHAEELNAAILVMAKHNVSPIKELFTGSVTNACLRRSKCPVLVFSHSDNLT
jgi:nucleotide-binding universal stress UspA family protein